MFINNMAEYEKRFHNPFPPLYACELKFFDAFLSSMHNQGIEVLVVGMPSLKVNRALLPERFWGDWREKVSALCARHKAHFLDLTASDTFCVADYLDTVHMNARGGKKLLTVIAGELGARPRLAGALSAGRKEATAAGADAVPH